MPSSTRGSAQREKAKKVRFALEGLADKIERSDFRGPFRRRFIEKWTLQKVDPAVLNAVTSGPDDETSAPSLFDHFELDVDKEEIDRVGYLLKQKNLKENLSAQAESIAKKKDAARKVKWYFAPVSPKGRFE